MQGSWTCTCISTTRHGMWPCAADGNSFSQDYDMLAQYIYPLICNYPVISSLHKSSSYLQNPQRLPLIMKVLSAKHLFGWMNLPDISFSWSSWWKKPCPGYLEIHWLLMEAWPCDGFLIGLLQSSWKSTCVISSYPNLELYCILIF